MNASPQKNFLTSESSNKYDKHEIITPVEDEKDC